MRERIQGLPSTERSEQIDQGREGQHTVRFEAVALKDDCAQVVRVCFGFGDQPCLADAGFARKEDALP